MGTIKRLERLKRECRIWRWIIKDLGRQIDSGEIGKGLGLCIMINRADDALIRYTDRHYSPAAINAQDRVSQFRPEHSSIFYWPVTARGHEYRLMAAAICLEQAKDDLRRAYK